MQTDAQEGIEDIKKEDKVQRQEAKLYKRLTKWENEALLQTHEDEAMINEGDEGLLQTEENEYWGKQIDTEEVLENSCKEEVKNSIFEWSFDECMVSAKKWLQHRKDLKMNENLEINEEEDEGVNSKSR